MLKSLWRRLPPSSLDATEDRALARYFRDEGLHADLERLRARHPCAQPEIERIENAARLYFAA